MFFELSLRMKKLEDKQDNGKVSDVFTPFKFEPTPHRNIEDYNDAIKRSELLVVVQSGNGKVV